jgi:hypothetical protein
MPEGRLHLDDYRRVVLAGFRSLPGDGAVAPTAAGHVVTPVDFGLGSGTDLYPQDAWVLDLGDCRYLGMAPGVRACAIRFPSELANAAAPIISTTASEIPTIVKARRESCPFSCDIAYS